MIQHFLVFFIPKAYSAEEFSGISRCQIFSLNRVRRLAQDKRIIFIPEKSCIKVVDDKKNKEHHFIEDKYNALLNVYESSVIEFLNGQEKNLKYLKSHIALRKSIYANFNYFNINLKNQQLL